MYCIKCGKEINEEQAFCCECLSVMERYPVKPNVKVLLPVRTEPTQTKKVAHRKKPPTSEEKIMRMQKTIQVLSISLVSVVLVLILSVALLFDALSTDKQDAAIGQNYNTVDHNNTKQ